MQYKCPKCGNLVDVGTKSCNVCGSPFNWQNVPVVPIQHNEVQPVADINLNYTENPTQTTPQPAVPINYTLESPQQIRQPVPAAPVPSTTQQTYQQQYQTQNNYQQSYQANIPYQQYAPQPVPQTNPYQYAQTPQQSQPVMYPVQQPGMPVGAYPYPVSPNTVPKTSESLLQGKSLAIIILSAALILSELIQLIINICLAARYGGLSSTQAGFKIGYIIGRSIAFILPTIALVIAVLYLLNRLKVINKFHSVLPPAILGIIIGLKDLADIMSAGGLSYLTSFVPVVFIFFALISIGTSIALIVIGKKE